MNIVVTIIAFAIALGVLIVVHEFGHYLVARWAGVKVLRFSLGFGKPLFIKRYGADQTEWVIAAFPLGGYVKMLDEREGEVAPHELTRAFNTQSVYRRFAIVLAGPMANFILAIAVFWLLFMIGIPGAKPIIGEITAATPAGLAALKPQQIISKINDKSVTNWSDVRWQLLKEAVHKNDALLEVINVDGKISQHNLSMRGLSTEELDKDFFPKLGLIPYRPQLDAIIGDMGSGGAAASAGLKRLDKILSVEGQPVRTWGDFVRIVRKSADRALRLDVLRGEQALTITLTPRGADENGQTVGKIGAGPWVAPEILATLEAKTSYGPVQALGKGIAKTWDSAIFTLEMLGRMIMGQVSWKNISGPITIADYAGQSANLGFMPYLAFIAAISIGLGIMNLLPIPLLDGGHLMYYMAEIIRGRPPTEQAMAIGQQVGIALLLTLMTFAFYNDINRLLSG